MPLGSQLVTKINLSSSDMEVDNVIMMQGGPCESDQSVDELGYVDEPLADEEWLEKYNEKVMENDVLLL